MNKIYIKNKLMVELPSSRMKSMSNEREKKE